MAYVTDTDLTATGAGQGANMVGFIQDGAGATPRTAMAKLRERVSITDFGAVSGSDVIAAVGAALANLGTTAPGILVFPKGIWLVGAAVDWSTYRNITFSFERGAVVDHGSNAITLPDRVDTDGSNFVGTAKVATRNKDEALLVSPPNQYLRFGNDARGVGALQSNTGGFNNLAWGSDALSTALSVRSSIAIGNEALRDVVGDPTGTKEDGTFYAFGDSNLAIGDFASRHNTTGYENIAIGSYALRDNTTGRWNIAIGHQAQVLMTGEANVTVGSYALSHAVAGSNHNTAIGWSVLEGQLSGSNTAVGYCSMTTNVSGTRNTALGALAMYENDIGDDNVAIGNETLKNATGNVYKNVAIGNFALGQIASGGTEQNTAIGYNAMLGFSTGIRNTAIGCDAMAAAFSTNNSAALGYNAQVTGSNQNQIGNSQTTTFAYGAVQDRSDARDKADVRDTLLGLRFVKALRPVDFRWDLRDDYRKADAIQSLGEIEHDGSKKRSRFHHGLIAQELKDVLDEHGIDFGGYQNHAINGGDDVLSIGYTELIAPLIKAVQELAERVEALEKAA